MSKYRKAEEVAGQQAITYKWLSQRPDRKELIPFLRLFLTIGQHAVTGTLAAEDRPPIHPNILEDAIRGGLLFSKGAEYLLGNEDVRPRRGGGDAGSA